MKTKIIIVVDLSSVDKYNFCIIELLEIIYTTRPSVGGATVGTCVYKTANIKGHALPVA